MEKHDLLHEFPQYQEKIHELKVSDAHFRKLFDEYHEIEHQIHRINMGSEVANDNYLHELKAKLLFLKDELYAHLNK
ncbi:MULTISPECIES: YdcH family protein [Flavobacterium]|uniref:YdcH family protein n=1 Tax=Flavobacterium TaxID=237 RepID=UPI00391B764D